VNLDELSRHVTEWSETRNPETLDGLVARLAEYLYLNMDRYRLEWNDEDRIRDYFSWLYPKFAPILSKFDPAKASFGTYLFWNVRMSWKSYIRASFSQQAKERVLEAEERTRVLCQDAEWLDSDAWVCSTLDEVAPYAESGGERLARRVTKKQRAIQARRILLLACKSSPFLDDNDIARVARETCYDEDNLRKKVEELRAACKEKNRVVSRSKERVNDLYFRVQRCKYEMKYLDSDSSRYADLKRECETCEKRLELARRVASRHHKTPSNRLLARTLGIPRGSVDSTLASARPDGYAKCP